MGRNVRIFITSLYAVCLTTLLATLSPAFAQADFYRGKTVSIVVGTRLTGTIGLTAQLVSRYLGRYIPGNPIVILRQMPGGAHLVASGHVYNVPEPDGLTILAANPAIAMAQLAKVKSVRFDVLQYQWLGSTGPDGMLFGIRSDLPYKTFKDIQNAKEDLVVGTTGPGSNSHDVPLLLPAPSCGCCLAMRPMEIFGSHSSARKSMAGRRSPAAFGALSSRG
jgi:tripartite-type tricarboxylate transporter receptor subunit TctC